jgi:hypothetical protein
MDAVWVCNKLVKNIQDRTDRIGQLLLNNELSDMAQYRSLMGEIVALGAISQEIEEIIQKGIQDDDKFGTILTGSFKEEEEKTKYRNG